MSITDTISAFVAPVTDLATGLMTNLPTYMAIGLAMLAGMIGFRFVLKWVRKAVK